jgi:hypothetical protein
VRQALGRLVCDQRFQLLVAQIDFLQDRKVQLQVFRIRLDVNRKKKNFNKKEKHNEFFESLLPRMSRRGR